MTNLTLTGNLNHQSVFLGFSRLAETSLVLYAGKADPRRI